MAASTSLHVGLGIHAAHMSNVINVSEGDFQNVLDQFKDILNREG